MTRSRIAMEVKRSNGSVMAISSFLFINTNSHVELEPSEELRIFIYGQGDLNVCINVGRKIIERLIEFF